MREPPPPLPPRALIYPPELELRRAEFGVDEELDDIIFVKSKSASTEVIGQTCTLLFSV